MSHRSLYKLIPGYSPGPVGRLKCLYQQQCASLIFGLYEMHACCLHLVCMFPAGRKMWQLVVGQGKHSQGGELKLKVEVLSWLSRMQLPYDVSTPGVVWVSLQV